MCNKDGHTFYAFNPSVEYNNINQTWSFNCYRFGQALYIPRLNRRNEGIYYLLICINSFL